MTTLDLSPQVFSILSSLIEEKVGLHYDLLDRDVLREKVSARAIDSGFSSLLDYYYFLRYDKSSAAEFNELIEALVVNETYFFREFQSLKILVDCFIEPLCKQENKVRIWSAACASGEEPLTLAMLLDQKGLLQSVEITASDISERVLKRAQSGKFSKRAVRSVPDPTLLDRYLTPEKDGFSVQHRLVSVISWEKRNLLASLSAPLHAYYDFVICRNVLIYFSDATVTQVLQNLSKGLKPDGVLLVGVSESLLRYGSAFIGEEHGGSFLYRKPRSQ